MMKQVRFCLDAPGARKVLLAGDFTGWEKEARPMRRSRPEGPFVKAMALPEGTHEYKFIVDGQWREDPDAESVPNAFGTRNSVVTVDEARTRRKAA